MRLSPISTRPPITVSETTPTSSLLDALNPVQREAAAHVGGPLLILAGAGSGKTRALTYRVAHLIEHGVPAHKILAVTFTNKAANEMRERIHKLVGMAAQGAWLGTFHAICARILRQDGEAIGLPRDFVVFDDGDQLTLVRESISELGIDSETYKPRQVLSAISHAKEELLGPSEYARHAAGAEEKTVARIYPVYQKKLWDNHAVDFDDLLLETVRLLETHPEVRDYYQSRFQQILVDEYQDINRVQYELVKLLAAGHRNLCVVGDDDQCLPAGTQVLTPKGFMAIEAVAAGNQVLGAAGWGETAKDGVDGAAGKPYQGKLIRIRTDAGFELAATPNHLIFGRIEPCGDLHHVYLMYRRGRGYRVVKTQGVRSRKASDDLVSGLAVRTNSEVADRIYILKTCRSNAEAMYYEQFFAFEYGIPTTVFHVRGRKMALTQDMVERLYGAIDTETRASCLMADLCIAEEYPHHRPSAVIRGDSSRKLVYLTLFGDARPHQVRPWHEHRITMISSDAELRAKVDSVHRTRNGRSSTWQVETTRKNYDEAVAFARRLVAAEDVELVTRARLTPGPALSLMPASHIQAGMKVPVYQDGRIVEATVTDVEWEDYTGTVYDLSVGNLRNYIANGIVVHNSVYGWRGADVRFILAFENDYPEARVLKLEQNYRSTQTILDAAHHVVKHNRGRRDKRLWTDNPEGEPLMLYSAEDEMDEARFIAQSIEGSVDGARVRYGDFACLYRTNAQSRMLEDVFRRRRLPYRLVGSLRFYDRREVRDLIAYLRLLQNPADSLSLKRVVNAPARGIGEKSMERLEEFARGQEITLFEAMRRGREVEGLTSRGRAALLEFTRVIDFVAGYREHLNVTGLLQEVIDKTGYLRALQEEKTPENQVREENVQEMVNVTKEFDEQAGTGLTAFLEQMALISDVDTLKAGADSVVLMTLHAAKGLEFPVVFLCGMEEDIFPHARAKDKESEMAEERRLCYVGITRAKEKLHLTHARRRTVFGQTRYQRPSRFLKEIPEELYHDVFRPGEDRGRYEHVDSTDFAGGRVIGRGPPAGQPAGRTPGDVDVQKLVDRYRNREKGTFQPGDRVRHTHYGDGIVTRSQGQGEDEQVSVIFPKHGEKKLIQGYARLEKL
jgi:DNA helicase II / ATP-dependent DNA helicase PcrA